MYIYTSAQILYRISSHTKIQWARPICHPISVSELGKYNSKLENKKSSGLDGITISNLLLKLSLPYIIISFTYVFNLCIENLKNLFELKKAKVLLLPKSMDKTNPTNY